jgi:quinol monooxygenase YgiN
MTVFIRAHFTVFPPRMTEFENTAVELRDTAAAEPGTLSYRWFSRPGSVDCFTLEEYVDSAAAMAHLGSSAELLARLENSSHMVLVELYGAIAPELGELMSQNPRVAILSDFP